MDAKKMEQAIDIYTWAKVEHVAAEQGRDVDEVAAELLEKEADRELGKGFAGKVEPTRLKSASGTPRRFHGVGVEPTRRSSAAKRRLRRAV